MMKIIYILIPTLLVFQKRVEFSVTNTAEAREKKRKSYFNVNIYIKKVNYFLSTCTCMFIFSWYITNAMVLMLDGNSEIDAPV